MHQEFHHEILHHLDKLLTYAPPEAYRDTVLEIYQVYLMHEHNTLPENFKEMADHIYFLTDFLKLAGKKIKHQNCQG